MSDKVIELKITIKKESTRDVTPVMEFSTTPTPPNTPNSQAQPSAPPILSQAKAKSKDDKFLKDTPRPGELSQFMRSTAISSPNKK